tara:strand:- start:36 stop:491 length:456 start_codon:yes stop_codon:yes gene_type:complete
MTVASVKNKNMAKFKKHMMYSKSGEGKMANTYEMHLSLKKRGWGHTQPKKASGGAVYNDRGMRVPGMYKSGGSTAAWQRKAGKNKSGGLNEKGRKSYEKENPGSDLKAPQPGGGSRKKSFCARMKGMRKRQKPSNNTGKDRLSLSLKKWKC